ncbi:SDR family oxidoreductase [Mucilaginibacter pedocola]|uniref:3-beta hydroxysteroid dehydrogenase n=1 Tax=Mucilaginibacter pedocola TaxID=1792845 RepID=A0A1S9PJQ5_9SPHI|nr:SDR family oxidoreductase [Mucilaginibacter pedocola]OOQ61183.1 3-beta hydroxysteroid dehydrogenase [Mucilaginibacter pedocola]
MKVFLTGATGFVGSAIIPELLNNGHQVLGLARNDAGAEKLIKAGAEVHRGDLEDLESLKSGAAAADAVIHTGFIHDFSRFAEVCQTDADAIDAMASVLVGTNKPLLVTSGTALVNPGGLATEDIIPASHPHIPRKSEQRADAAAALGVNAGVVRLSPSVHGEGDIIGFVPILVKTAREKGFSAYIGDGQNRWNAVHRLDAAQVYRLALDKTQPASRFHAVAEEAITFKEIAELIGKKLGLPVKSITADEATAHFGWFKNFASIDAPASSKATQELLGWTPTHSTLLADIEAGVYTK